MPPDIELALSAQAVSLTFYEDTFLFDQFEKVIVYPKPFPSPEHPYPHSSELYAPDGCLIFSAEHVIRAFVHPGKFYQVGLHEYAKAYILNHAQKSWPTFNAEQVWDDLEKLSGMSRAHVENVVGLSGLDPLPVAIHHYFTFPDNFRAVYPKESDQLDSIFSRA